MSTITADLQEATNSVRLAPEHEKVVQDTLPIIGAHIHEIAPAFYKRMFTVHPELLSDTFNRGNQRSGEQQKALAASVVTFASMLVNPDAPDPVKMLSRIAHKHVSLGIIEDQYQIVHDNLFGGIVDILGDAITPEVAAAWDEVYWLMAKVLIGAEKNLYDARKVSPGDVFRDATLTNRRELTERVTEFTFEVPDAGEAFAAAEPGQYTSIGIVMDDGARQLRQYSLVDWSDKGFTIGVQRDGEVSTALLDKVAVGDTVTATLPAGDLVLDDTDDSPVVLVSSGIGSTPMVGMLNALAARKKPCNVTVIHADRSSEAHAQKDITATLVEQLAEQGSTVNYHPTYGEFIQLTDLVIPQAATWYLCGGTEFLQNIRKQLGQATELQPKGVNYELFSPNDWLLD